MYLSIGCSLQFCAVGHMHLILDIKRSALRLLCVASTLHHGYESDAILLTLAFLSPCARAGWCTSFDLGECVTAKHARALLSVLHLIETFTISLHRTQSSVVG